MNGKTFVDSNVLIYAHDVDAGRKHAVAREIIRGLWSDRTGVLSVQILHEFYVNATHKISTPLSKSTAREVVGAYASWCLEPSVSDVAAAFRVEDEAQIGFWDAMVIASAARAGAVRLLSEDLNAGQTVSGVSIENPFAPLP